MLERKINILMLFFGMVGGFIGFLAGEWLLVKFTYIIPSSILMGIYFGVLALCIGIMCIMAEIFSTRINSESWRSKYYKSSLKYLIPCTFVMLFLCGGLFQYIYGLNFQKVKDINDVVMLIDISGSMLKTDSENKRFGAVESLVSQMDEQKRAAIFVFDDNTKSVQDMMYVTGEFKKGIERKLADYSIPGGQTNIKGVLEEAFSHITKTSAPDRAPMVILLSDGDDTFGLAENFKDTIQPYRKANIPVFTIGMDGSNEQMLKRISNSTGGNYYSVSKIDEIENIFDRVYKEKDLRLLMGERTGIASYKMLYAVMRVVFISLIGILIGLSVGLLFDNKYIARSLAIGGAAAGIAAGLIIEIGFQLSPWIGFIHRLISDISLGGIFTLFTLILGTNQINHTVKKRSEIKRTLDSDTFASKGRKETNSF